MKIMVTGSREWTRQDVILRQLRAWYEKGSELVVGDAKNGADQMAIDIWWRYTGSPPNIFKADWDAFPGVAGLYRSDRMVQRMLAYATRGEECVVLGFMLRPGTPGTLHALREARKAGLFVVEHLL